MTWTQICIVDWAKDLLNPDKITIVEIDVFKSCVWGACDCVYMLDGVRVQLKPCRVFAECYCRGDVDPDWDYILRGAFFGFKVIDDSCISEYVIQNYSSIDKVAGSMSKKLTMELAEQMISKVNSPCSCVHPFGAVPKGDVDFRAIVDCSNPDSFSVNSFTQDCKIPFHYRSLQDVTDLLQENDFLSTVDISNAYRAVHIHPTCRNRQGLSWDFGEGLIYLRDNRLCMGLSSSPFVFSKISDFIVRCLVREGFSECINYLDDFCLIGRTKEMCREMQWTLINILRRVGFYVSYKKVVAPKQMVRFLGIIVDSVKMTLSLPLDKIQKLKSQLNFFKNKRKASRLELEKLAGILAHACKVVHGGRTFSRRVYDLITSVGKDSFKIRLNEDFRLDLNWWLKFVEKFNGYTTIIGLGGAVISVYSDASRSGFGATCRHDWLAGTFGLDKQIAWSSWLGHHFSSASEPGCRTENINVLELWPILQAVRKWGSTWSNQRVIFVTDNTQVMAALNSGRSKNKFTMSWLRIIFWESINLNFEIQSVYINTKVNVVCDSLSRLDDYKNVARIRDVDVNKYMCCHAVFFC